MDLSNTVDILAAIGFAITGIFALIGIFNTAVRRRRTEGDQADSRLIALLKDEVAALQRRATEQESQSRENSAQIESLTRENITMRSLLQGHDTDTKAYRAQVMVAIKNSEDAVKMIGELSKMTMATSANVERLTAAIEKHLQIMEDKA